jgi:hypothetical protein
MLTIVEIEAPPTYDEVKLEAKLVHSQTPTMVGRDDSIRLVHRLAPRSNIPFALVHPTHFSTTSIPTRNIAKSWWFKHYWGNSSAYP